MLLTITQDIIFTWHFFVALAIGLVVGLLAEKVKKSHDEQNPKK